MNFLRSYVIFLIKQLIYVFTIAYVLYLFYTYILHGSLEWKNPPQIILGPSDENHNLSRMDLKYTLPFFDLTHFGGYENFIISEFI